MNYLHNNIIIYLHKVIGGKILSIRKKILYGLIGFSLIPLLISTLVSISSHNDTVDRLYDDRMRTVTNISALALQEIVNIYKADISMFSIGDSVQNFVDLMAEGNESALESSAEAIAATKYIERYINSEAKFDNVIILNKDGLAVISYHPMTKGDSLRDADFFNRILEDKSDRIYVSQVHTSLTDPDDPKSNCIGISKALYSSDGEFQGVVVGFLNVRALGVFAQDISVGKTGIAFVIDSENFILYHPESKFLNTKTIAAKLDQMIPRYHNGRLPPSGTIEDTMDGIKRVYYYSILAEDNLALVLRQDASESSDDTRGSSTFLMGLFVITAVAGVFFGTKAADNLAAPIAHIKKAFIKSRTEGKHIQCEVKTNDEFGEMALCYNEMIRSLEAQYELIYREKRKIERISMHDSVTDLNNRSGFENGLEEYIRGKEASFGVIFFDMDGFKQINDVYGHAFGDTLLYMLGRRIKDSAANFELYGRLGGDEFAIVKLGTREEVNDAATILMNELRSPFNIEMHKMHVTTSLGVAMYPDDGEGVEVLVNNADIAMYYSKDNGKNRLSFFNEEMQNHVNRQTAIMSILRKGIEKNQIYLVYQPELDLKNKKVVAYEALMRIRNTELGELGPSEFIPIAENNNLLINNLGHWVIVQACRFVRRMIDEQGFDGVVAVNVSVMQLRRDNFVDEIIGILNDERIDGKHLQLEFTESIMMFDMKTNAKKLEELRRFGVSVAIDDFGTHHASFAYLLNLPIDVIKVDHELLAEAERNDKLLDISEGIAAVAHKVGLKVIAEGVETESQRNAIAGMNYDVLQGYYYNHPMMESEVPGWHEKNGKGIEKDAD